MATSVIDIIFAHSTLLLQSIIHHVPTAKPHNILVWVLRLITLGFTVCTIGNCIKLSQGEFNPEPGSGRFSSMVGTLK